MTTTIRNRYEVGLCYDYDAPAVEKRGPYNTHEEASVACDTLNQELHPGSKTIYRRWPRWMWAREGEIPLIPRSADSQNTDTSNTDTQK